MTQQEAIKKIKDKTKGIRTAMLVTMNERGMHVGRPMSTQEIQDDGTLWFMTAEDTKKISEIKKNPEAAVLFGDGNGVQFVSISGKAELVNDRVKIKELWTDFYKAWFENEDDPNIILIKITTQRMEYWDYKGGKMGAYFDMAKSAITGGGMTHDENGIFET